MSLLLNGTLQRHFPVARRWEKVSSPGLPLHGAGPKWAAFSRLRQGHWLWMNQARTSTTCHWIEESEPKKKRKVIRDKLGTNWERGPKEQIYLFCELLANSLEVLLIKWYRSQCYGRGMSWNTKKTERCIMNINTSVNKALNVPSLYWSLKGTSVSKRTWTGSLLYHNLLKANKLLSSGERKELQSRHFTGIRI